MKSCLHPTIAFFIGWMGASAKRGKTANYSSAFSRWDALGKPRNADENRYFLIYRLLFINLPSDFFKFYLEAREPNKAFKITFIFLVVIDEDFYF
jgi:hypothetical protein